MNKVLFVSAEAAPFAKVGGMADVVGSLPQALRSQGCDTRVVMPGYGFIPHELHNIRPLFTFEFTHRQGRSTIKVFTTEHEGVPFYFLQGWPYFGEDSSVYTEWNWDVPRFIFFNQAVMAFMAELREREAWFPDIVHVHDWHTGILPFLIEENRWRSGWGQIGTVLSIHNIAYQGEHIGGFLWQAGIPTRRKPELIFQNLTDNALAIAIAYSDMVTTVSPRYAIEIQYPAMGYGLDGLIRARNQDVYGILNGLDMEKWNPDTDKALISNYNAENFPTKRPPNKKHLQAYAQLPVREETPIIGMVSRLVWQKGIDLAVPALRWLLTDTDVQFIVLGTGEAELEHELWRLSKDFSWKARAFLQYDAAVAQHIYAGCDIFLMPSHFEPCGIGQMIAMRYGALPLVRETGGLADTVINYDNEDAQIGTGFTFLWETPDAILGTMRWAIDTYHKRKQAWQRMQKRGMTTDFSWEKSASAYMDVYEKALQKHLSN